MGRLRKLRLAKGLTQVQLARIAGLEQTQISALERSDAPNPTWAVIVKLSKALDARPDEIFSMRSVASR